MAQEGRGAWKCLREIQKRRAGLRPVITKVIRKPSGEVCIGHEESLLLGRITFVKC